MISSNQALVIAERTFLAQMGGARPLFAVTMIEDPSGENWVFCYNGQGIHDRPGGLQIILVKKRGGEARFIPGQ
jgi:hypothetical protein